MNGISTVDVLGPLVGLGLVDRPQVDHELNGYTELCPTITSSTVG
jgi:hypothetical protein